MPDPSVRPAVVPALVPAPRNAPIPAPASSIEVIYSSDRTLVTREIRDGVPVIVKRAAALQDRPWAATTCRRQRWAKIFCCRRIAVILPARPRVDGTSEVTMNTAAEQQFRDFVVARSGALMRLAYLLAGGDQHAAEDLLQIALARTAARWSRIDSPETYVRRVMYHQQVNSWRLKWPKREVQFAELPEAVPSEPVRTDDMSAVDLKLTVRRALSRITPRQRAMLMLRFFEDLPEAEVARILGCSVGTVRSTTHRSLARLRELAPELNELNPIEEAVK
jgi:RNA polymerase sigma-70 factor (sigma-E family)